MSRAVGAHCRVAVRTRTTLQTTSVEQEQEQEQEQQQQEQEQEQQQQQQQSAMWLVVRQWDEGKESKSCTCHRPGLALARRTQQTPSCLHRAPL